MRKQSLKGFYRDSEHNVFKVMGVVNSQDENKSVLYHPSENKGKFLTMDIAEFLLKFEKLSREELKAIKRKTKHEKIYA